ncbi:hypothetical protein AALO_G00155230 [Alosa alosa]|uniref:BTB domain-containing protein n=1 Tax=Alosa alosa TaxID=278164 RepID=A0AAV6GFW2_9TELE|nr:kelch-like protein 42 [Alosa alosa]KAG5273764.1 hypothetical protein AALO_G00155230 [Alosa alosa]
MLAVLWRWLAVLWLWFWSWVQFGSKWVRTKQTTQLPLTLDSDITQEEEESSYSQSEEWKTDQSARTYGYHDDAAMVAVQTSTHTFYVDLEHLAECGEYFRALSHSSMIETSQRRIVLEHVPSEVFHSLLQFYFLGHFRVAPAHLPTNLQVSSYLLSSAYTSRLLALLSSLLTPLTCPAYLELSKRLGCPELRQQVLLYLSAHLLELPHMSHALEPRERELLPDLRSAGTPRLCCLRKENLSARNALETQAVRRVFRLEEGEEVETPGWTPLTEMPFQADKWCFTTAVLFNYLYLIGGYRHRAARGYEFKMASFRYNPLTQQWAPVASMIKHRRHFSAVACAGCVYAVGGWYLDSLVTPDSSTSLYTAVERYDPWADCWAFVASLPLSDFRFSLSLAHDSPLTAARGDCLYVLGSIYRTGEKLVLQYSTTHDCWSELLPTLTRTDALMPSLYFLGATDKLLVIGGNNTETMVTSFCVDSQRWGPVRSMEKMALIGQGTVVDGEVIISSLKHDSVIRLNTDSLSFSLLPSLPIPTCYESLFHLYF